MKDDKEFKSRHVQILIYTLFMYNSERPIDIYMNARWAFIYVTANLQLATMFLISGLYFIFSNK